MPDMSLYNLIHQAVDGAPGCGDECRMSTHSCSESSAFNREIDRLISAAGFRILQLDTGYLAGPKMFIFTYHGCAQR
jgi:hypothetical protein